MLKKSSLFLLFVLFTLSAFPLIAKAADSGVSLSATVVERKPTDTINDFDLSAINPDAYQNANLTNNTQIKGVSTVNKASILSLSNNLTLFYITILIIALAYALLLIKLTRAKRRIFISSVRRKIADDDEINWVASEKKGIIIRTG